MPTIQVPVVITMEVDDDILGGFISNPETGYARHGADEFCPGAFSFTVFDVYLVKRISSVSDVRVRHPFLNGPRTLLELYSIKPSGKLPFVRLGSRRAVFCN